MADILVVDDDDRLRKLIRIVVEERGHRVYEASNGIIALDLLKEHPVQLLITDIFMPFHDGISTIMDVHELYPEIKIIAMSGGGRREDIDFLALAGYVGASNIFKKPFELDDLRNKVEELLAR